MSTHETFSSETFHTTYRHFSNSPPAVLFFFGVTILNPTTPKDRLALIHGAFLNRFVAGWHILCSGSSPNDPIREYTVDENTPGYSLGAGSITLPLFEPGATNPSHHVELDYSQPGYSYQATLDNETVYPLRLVPPFPPVIMPGYTRMTP